MWLVVSSAQDIAALWVYKGLKKRGLSPIEIVTCETLAYALHFEHRINGGQIITRIALADGRTIDGSTVSGTLNRFAGMPYDHLRHAKAADMLYAQEELFAFFLSWLYGLPGSMINKPSPQGLNGPWRHLSQWMVLAQQAGLPTPAYQMSDQDSSSAWPESGNLALETVILLNGECFGAPVPEHIREGCARFSKLDGTNLLGIDFTIGADGQWLFTGATPVPDLRLGGEPFLDALVIALQP